MSLFFFFLTHISFPSVFFPSLSSPLQLPVKSYKSHSFSMVFFKCSINTSSFLHHSFLNTLSTLKRIGQSEDCFQRYDAGVTMEQFKAPQLQNDEPYPHVLALTCEEDSCSLRLFPPIPLQGEEVASSMEQRRRRLLSTPTQQTLPNIQGLISTKGERPRTASGQFHMDNNDDNGVNHQTRPESNGTNECHSDGEEETQDHGYDDSGYSLANGPQHRQTHHQIRRQDSSLRRMSVQTPFFTGGLVTDDDDENWNSRFQRVIEDLVGIGVNTHSSKLFLSQGHFSHCLISHV